MNDEITLEELGFEVPAWLETDITVGDLGNIVQGGCASGAYMPAVTYYQALMTMFEHGDAVLDYIEERHGGLPELPQPVSWAGLATHFLSVAVELWALENLDEAHSRAIAYEEEE